ncbi:MAG: prefoldin subunit beta [Nanoarchaeota archaeon]
MTEQEQILIQAQAFQQQLQSVLFQKETLSMQMIEIKRANEELEKTKESTVYKITGPLLVKVGKKEIEKELNEKEDTISLRIKTLEKNEMKIKDKLNSLREELSKKVGG